VDVGIWISATTLHFICSAIHTNPLLYSVKLNYNIKISCKYYTPKYGGKEGGGESKLHGGMEVCKYMHNLMTVEINDYKLTTNILFFSPTCGQGRQYSEKKCIINSNLLLPFSGPWPGHKTLQMWRSCSEGWRLWSFCNFHVANMYLHFRETSVLGCRIAPHSTDSDFNITEVINSDLMQNKATLVVSIILFVCV